jgi:hypothetical protein
MTNIQANFNFASITSDFQPAVTTQQPNDDSGIVDLFSDLSEFFGALGELAPQSNGDGCQCGTVSPPVPDDCCHPEGSLQVDPSSGVITTPGGYKIEQLGQYEWKITGQDGKWTRFWGDPHVQESDHSGASAWEFKRDSSFVLPDGTRINVTTKPYGNMTVTSQLEVLNGNDRVMVTDIDKGKGQVGQVTHDGWAHRDDFCGKDTFVMGAEANDWYFHGREVLGSNNGGDSFQLGQPGNDPSQFLSQLESFALRLLDSFFDSWPTGGGTDADQGRDRIGGEINAISRLFRVISRLQDLNGSLSFWRVSYQC